MNATAAEDLERGVVVEAEIALFNLILYGPKELENFARNSFAVVKYEREHRWPAQKHG